MIPPKPFPTPISHRLSLENVIQTGEILHKVIISTDLNKGRIYFYPNGNCRQIYGKKFWTYKEKSECCQRPAMRYCSICGKEQKGQCF